MRRSRVTLKILALAGGLAGATSLFAGEAPERVVSMNLCTDQLAMLLAAPGQLVSVSRIALDPMTSALWKEAAGYRHNSGRAEEIFAMSPDLVLGGTYSDAFAVRMLRDLDVNVVLVPDVSRLADIPDALRRVGAVLGRQAAADILAREVEARLGSVELRSDADAPEAAFFFANGYSLGAGTLSHDIVSKAGFANLAERLGRDGGGRLTLEELLLNRPDVLISGQAYPGASRSEDVAAHPALEGIPRVQSGPEWVCGTPFTMIALEQMIAVRDALE